MPGSGYFTNKMNLATMELVYVPKAFKLPQDLSKFNEYVSYLLLYVILKKRNVEYVNSTHLYKQ